MAKPSFSATSEARVRASLATEFARALSIPGFSPLVGGEWEALFPRFARYYEQLTRLPRRTRRVLQRQWKRSPGALALLLALGQAPALAAIIAVDGTTCTLVDAITAANTDTATGGCGAGSGADILQLVAGSTHTLTSINNTTKGPNGLPVVSSVITIDGHGSTISRGSSTPNFRIIAVNSTGDLTLNDTTVSGGVGYGAGGGIFNDDGAVTLTSSAVSGNSSSFDAGGVFNSYTGTLTLINSTVSGNSADVYGGGVYNSGTATLTNSTVSGNTAGAAGGVLNGFRCYYYCYGVNDRVTLNPY